MIDMTTFKSMSMKIVAIKFARNLCSKGESSEGEGCHTYAITK
jgi:hypothetical protein